MAPLSLQQLGYGDARAWWMIDFDKIQALNAGDLQVLQEFRKQEPEGMAKARALMLKLVDEAVAASGLPFSPPQTIMSVPVQTAVCLERAPGDPLVAVPSQESDRGL